MLMILRLMLTQVEEERNERVKMGWYLAISQGTILALIFMLIKRNNVLSEFSNLLTVSIENLHVCIYHTQCSSLWPSHTDGLG